MITSLKRSAGVLLSSLMVCATVCLTNCTSGPSGSIASVGPIDGGYNVTAWTCGSTNLYTALQTAGATIIAFNFANGAGSQVTTFGVTCTGISTFGLSYPAASSTIETLTGTACTAACTASQCTSAVQATPAVTQTWGYTKSSGALTMTYPLTSADVANTGLIYGLGGCTAGQTVTLTLAR